MRALISIGGVDLPTPSSYKPTVSTLVDGGRNAQGDTIGAVIREIEKVEAEYNFLEVDQWSDIIRLFSRDYMGNFYAMVTFYSIKAKGWVTKKMYTGDRTSDGVLRVNRETGIPEGIVHAKLSLIEA